MIKKLIIILILTTSCKSQNVNSNNNKDKVIWSILFADGFKKSYVDLSLNEQKIIENGYLDSDESDGVTSTWLRITKEKDGYYVSTSQEKTLKSIDLKIDEITLSIIYKGVQTKFKIKKNDGKFVLISNEGENRISISQRKSQPVFD